MSSLPLDEIQNCLSRGENLLLKGFNGSSSHFLFHYLYKSDRTLLIVTPEFEKAVAIASDLEEMETGEVYLFPPTRIKPYNKEKVSDLSVLVQRSEVLEKISDGKASVIVASADAIAEKLVPAEQFRSESLTVRKGERMSPDSLTERLAVQGYTPVRFVDEPGEYALRGGILDIFPFSGEYPVRFEFFGDEIDSIREFDPDSQRSIAFLEETRLIPNATLSSDKGKESILNYLPTGTLIAIENSDLVLSEIDLIFSDATSAYQQLEKKDELPPEHNFLTPAEWTDAVEGYGTLFFGPFSGKSTQLTVSLPSTPHPSFNGDFKQLREFILTESENSRTTLILCQHPAQRERFTELLGEESDQFRYRILMHTLHEGFMLPEHGYAILTDHQIFDRYHRPKVKRKQVRGGISFKELKELKFGDYVVHVDYGIGKFAGFKKIEVRGAIQEAAVVRYQEDSILYVNVSSLHKLQKYSGKEGAEPRITKLGSGEWARKKAATRKKVKDIARDLIELYAKRKAQQAFRFDPDTSWQMEMEARFEFEETPDQMTAIEAVKRDMESDQPMDRLVCGDVGFGKTEVAVRAAFKAVMNQKQVALLVPTTILADQHYKTFTERMKDFPVQVESISRFRNQAEQKKIIERTAEGKTDILIGTHRLLSKDVQFRDLGLMIIDEEQRFGVAMKEKLKAYRATMDVLTLTATPIPRTLQFSLMGARDLSIINTPPLNRQPVYTEIHSFDAALIRDAIIEEVSRGGQVFFIHNRVKNIEEVGNMIRELVPDIRVRFAHGQIPPAKLEKIIQDFYMHSFDVLVSTNIVENGIDISNANTIIIHNAHQFGLSELHQLRGRVGRSNRKAFCYLITPQVSSLTPEARKRLTALEEFSDLGSGFSIAMRDLDIRGAGDILGAEQSGYISDIGFELYTKILDDAVRELKESEFSELFTHEKASVEKPDTKVEFDESAYLDEEYISDSVERLNLYRRLSALKSQQEISEWQEEIKDRFGPIPEHGEDLIRGARIKLEASSLYFSKVTIRAGRMWLVCPGSDTPSGDFFFGSGLFQKMIEKIQQQQEQTIQVVQKNDMVTLIVTGIESLDSALNFLNRVGKWVAEKEESLT